LVTSLPVRSRQLLGPEILPGEVHLWFVRFDGETDHADLLSSDEWARATRIVRWPNEGAWLRFSPSRSGSLAVVAVARDQDVGVDVEGVRPNLDFIGIASRALGDGVARELASKSGEERVTGFYRAWVREEARGKCRGTGLVEPDEEGRETPMLVTDLELSEGYAGALAVAGHLGGVRCCWVDV
jgi:hypothetical protein